MCLGPAVESIDITGPGSVLRPFMGLHKSRRLHPVLTGARAGTARRRATSGSALASSVGVLGWVRARLCSGCPQRGFRSENLGPRLPSHLLPRPTGTGWSNSKGRGEYCFGHSHSHNYVGNGGLLPTFKSPRDGNRPDSPSHSSRFVCADGRGHSFVKLRKRSSLGPAKWSWAHWSRSLSSL